MPVKNKTGLDTTVVLRLLTGEPEKQFKKARQFIQQQIAHQGELFVSDLVIAESYFALHYYYKVPKEEALRQLDDFLSSGIVHPAPGGVCQKILKESKNHKAGFVDQMIHEQYSQFADQIASFDKLMSRLGRVFNLEKHF